MIIQCNKCGTNYRFDEILIDGDGVWVRCTRCQNIFFLENPAEDKILFKDEKEYKDARAVETIDRERSETTISFDDDHPVSDNAVPREDRFVDETRDQDVRDVETADMEHSEMTISFDDDYLVADDTVLPEDHFPADYEAPVGPHEPEPDIPAFFDEAATKETSDIAPVSDETPEIETPEKEPASDVAAMKPSGKRTKVLAFVFVLLAAAFAVYLILFPQIRQNLVDRILAILPSEETVVSGDAGGEAVTPRGTEIYFIDTKEHAVNNWIVGDILVVEGIAINKSEYSASKVKVRGKILDAAGTVLMEEISYGGTVLTEEELRNLTEDELRSELSNPWGRDFDNRDISKDGKLPFMIVFINPPENSQEYVIDLADVDIGTRK